MKLTIEIDINRLRKVLKIGESEEVWDICKKGTDDEVVDTFIKIVGRTYGFKRGE